MIACFLATFLLFSAGSGNCFWSIDQSSAPFKTGTGSYEGHKVYRVKVSNATVKGLLAGELEKRYHFDAESESLVQSWDSWSASLKTGSDFDVRIPPTDQLYFESLPLEKSVLIENVQSLVDVEFQAQLEASLRLARTQDDEGEFFKKYHTLDELNAWMDNLAEKYPSLVKKIEIGTSYEKRAIRGIVLHDQVQGASEKEVKRIVFHGLVYF